MRKPRVLYILFHFPQISETYIRSEIEAIQEDCEVRVVSLRAADLAYANHVPYTLTEDPEEIRRIIREFAPDVLHTHWLQQAPTLAYFAGYFDRGGTGRAIPFTVRAHSFDTLGTDGEYIRQTKEILNSDLCLGVLTFPFTRTLFEEAGVRAEKVLDCWPVVNYARFHDRSPNGERVMNVGACLPKKQMQDFVALAGRVPEREFDLYAMGYNVAEMQRLNEAAGTPVHIVPPVQPEEMAAEYKKHAWLVYTAAHEYNTVGWPMAVAEAQAAGVGVCLPNLRPDLRDYVGPSGILYDSIEEVAEIVSRPLPDELREIGFEHAKKSDVAVHRSMLTGLWSQAAGSGAPVRWTPRVRAEEFDWKGFGTDWHAREQTAAVLRELADLLPARSSVILVDEGQLSGHTLAGRQTFSLVEKEGVYWGPPADDAGAVEDLERLRGQGARYVAFVWPAFWWLQHYTGLREHLCSHFSCLMRNERVVVFDMETEAAADAVETDTGRIPVRA